MTFSCEETWYESGTVDAPIFVVVVGSVVVGIAVIVLRSPLSSSRGSLAAILFNN